MSKIKNITSLPKKTSTKKKLTRLAVVATLAAVAAATFTQVKTTSDEEKDAAA